MRGNFSGCGAGNLVNGRMAALIAGICVLAAAPAQARYIGPGPGSPPPGPQTVIWQNPSGGSFSGNNWGGTAYLMGTGPLTPMPPDYQTGIYTGVGYSNFMFQASPGAADTAVFVTLATGNNNPSANVLPTFNGNYICCSAPNAVGYVYPELPAGTASYSVSLNSGAVAELDAVSTGNVAVGAAPSLALTGAFTATNLTALQVTSGSTPITISGSGSLASDALQIAGNVNVTGGTLLGTTTTIDGVSSSQYMMGSGTIVSSTLKLTGTASTLLAPTSLYIDRTANTISTLDLEAGAQALTGNVYVALGSTQTNGTITINGAGSLLATSNGFAAIGYNGLGGLTISNGGRWLLGGTTGNVFISGIAGSTGIANVSGAGSQLGADGYIIVGQQGLGGLTVADTATVTGNQGVFVGNDSGSNAYGSLNISSGGQVNAAISGGAAAYASILGGSTGALGAAVINGAGSLWSVAESMRIGADGTGSVTISNGGKLEVDGATLEIGSLAGGRGTLTINGSGSTLALPNGALVVGSAGTGTVTLQNGALLDQSNKTLVLGSQASGNGTIEVESGSNFNVANLTLGGAGTGELDIGVTDTGGNITTGTATITGTTIVIGRDAGSNGKLDINGNSTLNFNGTLQDGLNGTGTIGLRSGANLATSQLTMGVGAGSTGNLIILSGSHFGSTGDLVVGAAGQGAVTIASGGTAAMGGDVILGQNFGSSGNSLTIGSGGGGTARMALAGNLVVGQADQTGDIDTVALLSGAQVSVGHDLTLGGVLTAGTLAIAGAGTAGGQAFLGYDGVLNVGAMSGASISGGGMLMHTSGGGTDVDSGHVTVQGTGSDWHASSTVDINGSGALSIGSGAHAEIGSLNIDSAAAGDGDVSVDGASSNLTLSGDDLSIDDGGSLHVSGSAIVNALQVSNFELGGESNGSATLSVSGQNTFFNADNAATSIGPGGGGGGVILVQAGGNVSLGNITMLSGASIQVAGTGSYLMGENLTGGAATENANIQVKSGGLLDLDSIDNLYLTNFTIDDSRLNVGAAAEIGGNFTASNGSMVKIGGNLSDIAAGTVAITDSTLTANGIDLSAAPVALNVTNSVLNLSGELNIGQNSKANIDSASTVNGLNTIVDAGSLDVGNNLQVNGVFLNYGVIGLGSLGTLTIGSGGSNTIHPGGSQLIVTSSGDLSGTGSIIGSTLNGGVFHVGDDPGTIDIVGNYAQLPTGKLQIEVGPTSVSQLNVTGTASLAGTLALDPVDGGMVRIGQTYDILNSAGGITGEFSTYDTGSPFITLLPQLADGMLDFTAIHAPNSFADLAQTSNQATVAEVLDAAANNPSGGLANGIEALSYAPVTVIRSSFDSLSGEAYGNLATVAIGQFSGFGTAMLDQLAAANGAFAPGTTADRTTTGRYNIWAEGMGNFGNDEGGAYGSHSFNYSTSGMAAGFDTPITRNWLAGLAFGYGHNSLSAGSLQSNADMDNYDFALYSGVTLHSVYIRSAVGYMGSNALLSRTLHVAGATSFASGNPNGKQMFGNLETGDEFTLKSGLDVIPFARLDAARYWQDSTTEAGAGSFDLNVAGQMVSSAQTTLGAALSKVFAFTDLPLTVLVKAGWDHEFADTDRPVSASFTGAAGLPFTVEAAPVNRNTAIISAGLSTTVGRANLFVRYNGQYGSLTNASAVTGGVAIAW